MIYRLNFDLDWGLTIVKDIEELSVCIIAITPENIP